jgi:hypothetical protein
VAAPPKLVRTIFCWRSAYLGKMNCAQSAPKALCELATPTTPDEVRTEIQTRIEAGEFFANILFWLLSNID